MGNFLKQEWDNCTLYVSKATSTLDYYVILPNQSGLVKGFKLKPRAASPKFIEYQDQIKAGIVTLPNGNKQICKATTLIDQVTYSELQEIIEFESTEINYLDLLECENGLLTNYEQLANRLITAHLLLN